MRNVNLMQIVRQTHADELENITNKDQYQAREKKLFDQDSARLRDVMISVNFYPDLLKENGAYRIPQEDGEFIQWILENYTSDNMKYLRKGNFEKIDIYFLSKILSGFDGILKHIGANEKIRAMSHQLANQRTHYDENVLMFNIRLKHTALLQDINMIFSSPAFALTYADRIECLEKINALTEKYTSDAVRLYSDIIQRRQDECKKYSYPISIEELAFSEHRKLINEELYANEEFRSLMIKLNALKFNAKFRVQNEKARIKIVKRIAEIKKDILKRHPLDKVEIEKMTKLEQLMLLTDEPFRVYNDSKTDLWYVSFGDDVSWLDEHYSMIVG